MNFIGINPEIEYDIVMRSGFDRNSADGMAIHSFFNINVKDVER